MKKYKEKLDKLNETRTCSFCKKNEEETPGLIEHHLVPKSIGGTDEDGRILLCKNHHERLYRQMVSKIFYFIPREKQQSCRDWIIDWTMAQTKNGNKK